jgi:hypothetical protein
MDAEFWKDRWANNEIGFHRTEGNPLLLAYAPQLASYTRVYVPLCGKSLDMVHLQQRGHRVFGTELAETAVEQFYREQGVIPVVTITSKYGRYVGAGTETATAITLLLGNAFALDPADLDGPVDAVYDRASLVALDPATRTQLSPVCSAFYDHKVHCCWSHLSTNRPKSMGLHGRSRREMCRHCFATSARLSCSKHLTAPPPRAFEKRE